MLDYGAFPPEFNSARMYAGAGSGPMMAAASAWNALAAELSSTASSYEAVINGLISEQWLGPASASMAAAAAPYLAWMNNSAAEAQKAAEQAAAAASAYEAAFSMTVPPPVVAANRAELAMLVATNVLGQNTPAIAANEAQYAEMWAQDAAAMYGYAANSAVASQLTPFDSPAQTTNGTGVAGQAAAVAQATSGAAGSQTQVAQLMSSLPNVLQNMSSPLASTGLSLAAALDPVLPADAVDVVLNGISSGASTAAMYIPSTLIPSMIGYFAGPGFNAEGGGVVGGGLGALLAPGGPLGNLGALGGGLGSAGGGAAGAASAASAVTGGVGQASLVGSLSVPPSWAATTPAGSAAGALQPAGWAAAPESNTVAAMPGAMPAGAMGSRGGFGMGAPRYGFKPTVMGRPVVAG
ncbi:PPE family protein PPE31, partial [Mycobacterium tuberculosis H37Rv] [Mycobacterium shimoidei]|uniref:PPE family protein PPE31, partial [Mycobacterium tuberculosis H37Rv] n=1 Tax=Mycobacterium shimoidei TaxID=29313 RepID=A0A375YYY0_MYCSH